MVHIIQIHVNISSANSLLDVQRQVGLHHRPHVILLVFRVE
jgi:hypothetical protein